MIIVDIIGSTLLFLCFGFGVAYVVMAAVGVLFSGLTRSSSHVHWFLPCLTALVGIVVFGLAVNAGGFQWWQPYPGIALLWLAAREIPRHRVIARKTHSDLRAAAILKSSVVLVGLTWMALISMSYHHG